MTQQLTKDQVIEYLSNLPQMEIKSLIEELEGKWGVKAAPIGGALIAPAPPPGVTDPVQTEFDVMLVDVGAKKIEVIKVVKDLTGLGLKEAKEFTEALPKRLKEGISRADADEIKAKIEAAGGKVEIK